VLFYVKCKRTCYSVDAMPSRNIVKVYDTESYYHVYNRGAGNQKLFLDANDKRKFLSLIERYVTPKENRDDSEKSYPEFDIEINAFCLMGNHFHLLVYQMEDRDALSGLMRSVSTAYSMYFNKKYKRHGHVFQSVFKASRITDESYLKHITRYIHMNPRTYMTYRWSSLGAYLDDVCQPWIKPERVMTLSPERYKEFLREYESKKAELEDLKLQLAA
jgi:putative transposase